MRHLTRLVVGLKRVENVAPTTEHPQHSTLQTIAASSGYIRVDFPARNVAFIQFRVAGRAARKEAKALVVELRATFAELQRGDCNPAVLGSEYTGFLPGITPAVDEALV